MSALPPKADIVQHERDVRFVPKADIAEAHGAKKEVPLPGWKKVLLHVAKWLVRPASLYGGHRVPAPRRFSKMEHVGAAECYLLQRNWLSV